VHVIMRHWPATYMPVTTRAQIPESLSAEGILFLEFALFVEIVAKRSLASGKPCKYTRRVIHVNASQERLDNARIPMLAQATTYVACYNMATLCRRLFTSSTQCALRCL
jgi:hypothetical protein